MSINGANNIFINKKKIPYLMQNIPITTVVTMLTNINTAPPKTAKATTTKKIYQSRKYS